MTCGIYKLTNKINGMAYIGASSRIEKRFHDHKYNSRKRMYSIIHKYGLENFSFEILEECLKEELRDKERHYIAVFNTEMPNGYNLTKGGEVNYNKSGFYHVSLKKMKSGSIQYNYFYMVDGKKRWVASVFIDELEKKVKDRGLPWRIIDEENAKRTILNSERKKQEYTHQGTPNNSGYYRVSKTTSDSNVGYDWRYSYYENGKLCHIISVDLDMLKTKVEYKGLPWFSVDEEKAKYSDNLNKDNKNKITPYAKTGFYRVSVSKGSYRYRYFDESKKRRAITSMSLLKLEQKVKSKGLPWRITDKQLAKKTLKESRRD